MIWAEHLYGKISDVESMIRIAFLALTKGCSEEPASSLDRSADRVRSATTMRSKRRPDLKAKVVKSAPTQSDVANQSPSRRSEAEAGALREIERPL
jgi:hypothetical protein